MSTITQFFQPPLYWQQFEDLTEGVFREVYGERRPHKVGRPGQSQHGIDVYGRENGNGRLIGIQCKRMDELDENNHPHPGGAITKKMLDDELAKVRRGDWTRLDEWILATTAKRDRMIQQYALQLEKQNRDRRSFGIRLWFWEDFVTDLNRHHKLQEWYYEKVIQVRSEEDQDRLILELIGEAFSRPAFRVPLHQETPAHFVQALKDTQHAVNVGELKDRETRRVIRKTVGGRRAVADETIAAELKTANDLLHDLRIEFQQAKADGTIIETPFELVIQHDVAKKLQKLREQAIEAANRALKVARLPPI